MATARAEHHVSLARKLAYGAAGPVETWAVWTPKSIANQIFNMSLGLPPAMISMAFMIFRLWDAFTDPLMGWISDNTRTRWGRRRPYIVLGAIATAAVFPLFWVVNRAWSHTMMGVWLCAVGFLFYACFTVWSVPYQSLLLEMTPDYHERTRITAVRAMFGSVAGVTTAWLWAITQLPCFRDPLTGQADTLRGMRAVALVIALLILILGVLPGLFVKERYYATAAGAARTRLRDSFSSTLSNRPFLLLIAVTIMFSVGTGMTEGFNVYVNTYYVNKGNQVAASILQGWHGTMVLVTSMLSLPLFEWLSRRMGKTRCLMVCLALLAFSCLITWVTYTPRMPYVMLVTSFFGAPARTGLWMMIPSMCADIVDHDELRTGQRREGSFSAVFSWALKLSTSIAFGISGPLLMLTGFDVHLGATQPAHVLQAMRLVMALVPSSAAIFALLLLTRYPLSCAAMATIRRTLEQRRGAIQ